MMLRAMVAGLFIGIVASAHAEGSLFKVPTREGVVTTLFWEAAPDAKATVFLFPGGGGGFGKVEDGNHADVFWVRPESKSRLISSSVILAWWVFFMHPGRHSKPNSRAMS